MSNLAHDGLQEQSVNFMASIFLDEILFHDFFEFLFFIILIIFYVKVFIVQGILR